MSDPRTIQSWLPDYYANCDDNPDIQRVLRGIWQMEVDSETAARERVNARLDAWIAWLRTLRC